MGQMSTSRARLVQVPSIGGVWAERSSCGPLATDAYEHGLVVVTAVSASAWGPCCAVVHLNGHGSMSGRVADVLRGHECIGQVQHGFDAHDLKDARGRASRQLVAAALELARGRLGAAPSSAPRSRGGGDRQGREGAARGR